MKFNLRIFDLPELSTNGIIGIARMFATIMINR